MKNRKKQLIILTFIILFLSTIMGVGSNLWAFPVHELDANSPSLSTNYLFKDIGYNITLEDVYDDEDLDKLYTGAYFQSQYFNSPYEWEQIHNETVDSGVDNNYINNPHSELYYATYGFDDQPVGTSGTDINGVYMVYTGSSAIIENSIDCHSKVINFSLKENNMYKKIVFDLLDKTNGTIEAWIKLESDIFQWQFAPDISGKYITYFSISPDKISVYYNNTIDKVYKSVYLDTHEWTHVKLQFNYSTYRFSFWINNILELDNVIMVNQVGTYLQQSRIQINTNNPGTMYIDAIGYSWDSTYTIGDNYYPEDITMINGTFDNSDNMKTNDDSYSEFDCNFDSASFDEILRPDETIDGTGWSIYSGSTYHGSVDDDIEYPDTDDDEEYIYTYSSGVDVILGLQDIDETINSYEIYGFFHGEPELETWVSYDGGAYYWFIGQFEGGGVGPTWESLSKSGISENGQNWQIKCKSTKEEASIVLALYVVVHYGFSNSELNFTIDMDFNNIQNKNLLALDISSFHYTNISQTIIGEIYNYDSSSYVEMFSSSNTVETENYFMDDTSITDYLSESQNLRLQFRGHGSSDFKLFIDYITVRFFYKMNLWHEISFNMTGLWRYRWEIHGSLQYTDWTCFEIVDPIANFHAISESDLTTRWILQGSDISAVEDFHDDINTNYWALADVSSPYMSISQDLTADTYIMEDWADNNYGYNWWVHFAGASATYGRTWSYISHAEISYLSLNTSNSYLKGWSTRSINTPDASVYSCGAFSEFSMTWNTKIFANSYIDTTTLTNDIDAWHLINLGSDVNILNFIINSSTALDDFTFHGRTASINKPNIVFNISKNYFGSGYMYMQTNETETIALKSEDYETYYTLSSGDYFEVDLQTNSDSQINLILLKDGVIQKTLILSQSGNTNFNRRTVQISVSENLEFDQLKISSTFEDADNVQIFDIKTMKYTITGDYKDFYVGSRRTEEVYLTPDDYNLRIFEEGLEKINTNITIGSSNFYYVYIPIEKLQCRLTLYSKQGVYLDFPDYHIVVNRSLNGQYNEFNLLENIFYADKDSYVYIDVYDRFNNLINSFSKLASSYIDLELEVYQLQIKNLMEYKTTVNINSSYVYQLLPYDSLYFMLSKGYYQIGYYDDDGDYQQFMAYLNSNQAYVLNRSQMCFLSYTNQRGQYLEFYQFKTYINGTILYQNLFYEDIGDDVNITITDLYDYKVYEDVYTIVSGDNFIPITLTMYSLKVMNQQESFNHINITRDPNYYESPYFWSEWIAPNEIIEFRLFSGYYKINLTDNENGGYSFYAYTLSGDDILLISSDNIISQVIYNIENINTTIGNQITNVQIDLTNQNSQINNSIINVEINLENINSSIGDLLVSLSLDIENIENNINSLYVFTENSFIDLQNNIDTSFISVENNFISINQSISNLIIGMQNDLWLINGTISTFILDIGSDMLLMNTSIHTLLFSLDVDLTTIGSDIDEYYIILNNSINLLNSNVNDSRIAILNNLALINNTLSNMILQVYDSVYLINNSIYTATIDLGTSLTLMNNSISGDLSIILQQNDFLTELYRMTMFSELLNWTNIGSDPSLITSQIDAWEFINKYNNYTGVIFLKYQDKIMNFTISAQNTISQWLPIQNTEYKIWDEKKQEYLDEWQPLPENKTVDFGFFETKVPAYPNPINYDTYFWAFIIVSIGLVIIIILYGRFKRKYYRIPERTRAIHSQNNRTQLYSEDKTKVWRE